MHSFRTLSLSLLLLFASQQSYSQQDKKAEPYLQAVSNQFDMEEGYLIEMDYIREDIMRETSAEGEGKVWMRGLKYKIVVDEFIVYYNGEKLFSQNTETEEVYVSVPDPDQPGYLQAVPIRIIKSYEQDFKYMYIGSTPFLGKERIEIQLYPKEVSGPYSMLKMFINPHSYELEAFQLKHKEGILYTMILSKLTGNQSFEDSLFSFDPLQFPETEVIELLD